MNAHRHAVSALVGLGAVAALAAVVSANGFTDFGSAFWVREAASVGALGYVLALLVLRALGSASGVWRRASAFGGVVGAVVTVLAFARLADLNTSGVAVALTLLGALGVTLGLAAVEGLRWVRGAPSAGGAA